MIIKLVFIQILLSFYACSGETSDMKKDQEIIKLPAPVTDSQTSLEYTINMRRSVREYKNVPLSVNEVSQLLWAAQGITLTARGFRAAPSAGATFPMEVYLIIGQVTDLKEGVYRYLPEKHSLEKVFEGDKRREIFNAALQQSSILQAPVSIVLTGVVQRTERRYGQRALRYVYMEAGHVAQNIYLQAVSLNLGTVVIGAFYDDDVGSVLQLPAGEHPLYIMPVGKPR